MIEEQVSADEANRSFSKLLEGVREGRHYVVTRHGKPVAKIVPPDDAEGDEQDEIERRRRAWDALLERVSAQPRQHMKPWTREELYEDED